MVIPTIQRNELADEYPIWLPRSDFENSLISASNSRIDLLNHDGTGTIIYGVFAYGDPSSALPTGGTIHQITVYAPDPANTHVLDMAPVTIPVTLFLTQLSNRIRSSCSIWAGMMQRKSLFATVPLMTSQAWAQTAKPALAVRRRLEQNIRDGNVSHDVCLSSPWIRS